VTVFFRHALHRRTAPELKIPDSPDVALSAPPASFFQDFIFLEKIPPRKQPGGGDKISAFVLRVFF